ncbi:hypothetical protein AMJ86_05470 [bacterium SM23_57]|nr:MAG: hypothetical protein AMJ86_05470 [bacterium SM23_57]
MDSSFDSLLHELMRNEKFQNSMIQQLADFGDRLIQEIQEIPEGGIGGETLENNDIWPDFISIEAKSHSLTHLMESLSDSILRIDRSGIIRGTNLAAENLFSKPRKELTGKPFLNLVYPKDRDQLFDLWSASLKNQHQSFHLRLLRGKNSHVATTARAIPLIHGNRFQGTLLVIKSLGDQAEQKEARSAAKRGNSNGDVKNSILPIDITSDKLRRVFHDVKEIFYVASADGSITYVNPEVQNVLGYTPEEFRTINIEDKFKDPQDRTRFSKLLRLHGWVKDFRFCFLNKSGETCHLSETASIISDKNDHIIGYFGIIRDRTAEHQIKKSLKDSEENYRTMVEQIPYALILLDFKGKVLHANKHGTQFLNFDNFQAIKGRSVFEVCLPDNSRIVREAIQDISPGVSITNEWQWADSVGNLHWWKMTFNPVICSSDTQRIIWICSNIDREKRLQDHLRLRQKMETVATLISGLAHDFNNQLGVILGNASFVKDQLQSDAEFYEELNSIESTALEARKMMNQLMTFTPKMHNQHITFSMNELVQNIEEFVLRTFPKNIRISSEIKADPDIIVGDPDNIYQALLNICVNARDAMPDGGHITLTTENITRESIIHGQNTHCFIQISISDSGEGMDKETCRRMCEPFFTTKQKSGCSGLGMSTTYSIIQHHMGILEVDSIIGQGTTVNLFLPQADCEEQPPETDDQEQPQIDVTNEKGTVLVVDDEPQVRAMILRIFLKEGFKVFLAENGVEALNILQQHVQEIQLVLLDMSMPQMNGSETLSHIRKQYPDIPVLLSSGYTMNQEIRELTKHPQTHFIHKPYRRSLILETVQNILAKSARISDD